MSNIFQNSLVNDVSQESMKVGVKMFFEMLKMIWTDNDCSNENDFSKVTLICCEWNEALNRMKWAYVTMKEMFKCVLHSWNQKVLWGCLTITF